MITIENLTKEYFKNKILDNISLNIGKAERVGILGPSGCGKTTLLKCIHGLDNNYEGTIKIEEETGYMFQDFNLFNNMSVSQNILYVPLKIKKIQHSIIYKRLEELVKLFKIENILNKKPYSLSGGQKQRAAFIRTIILKPAILLLDEPTSALDQEMAQNTYKAIEWLGSDTTILIISHQNYIINSIANRIIELKDGTIIKDSHKKPNSI